MTSVVVEAVGLPEVAFSSNGSQGVLGEHSAVEASTERFGFLNSSWHAAWARHLIPSNRWKEPATVFRLMRGDLEVAETVFASQTMSLVNVFSLGGYYWPFRGASLDIERLEPAQYAASMANALTRRTRFWVLRLSPILDRDVAMQALSEQLRASGWFRFTRESGKVFELSLPPSAAALQSTMSASLLRNIRYMRRRAEKDLGAVRWDRYSGASLTVDRLDEAASVEEKSWVSAKQGDVKLLGAENRRFWQQIAAAAHPGTEVALWILRVGGHPAAFSLNIETDRTLCILANSYVHDLKQYSLGSVLSYQVLCDAIERGRRFLDWGSGDSGYKQKWGAKAGSALQEHLFFRPTLAGRMATLALGRAGSGWTRTQ